MVRRDTTSIPYQHPRMHPLSTTLSTHISTPIPISTHISISLSMPTPLHYLTSLSHPIVLINTHHHPSPGGTVPWRIRRPIVCIVLVKPDPYWWLGSYVRAPSRNGWSPFSNAKQPWARYQCTTPYTVQSLTRSHQYTLSIHPINTPYQYTLSIHPLNPSHQYTR